MHRRNVVLWIILVTLVGSAIAAGCWYRSVRIDAQLHDPSPAVRVAAIRGLDKDRDLDLLLAALKDEDADVRLVAVMQLETRRYTTMPPQCEKTAAALIEILKDRHAGVRRAAAESLGLMWPCSESALTRALKDSDTRVRAGAAFALSCAPNVKWEREVTPAQAKLVRPPLQTLLKDGDAEVRENAARALDSLD
jgi:HEAT repeat protein